MKLNGSNVNRRIKASNIYPSMKILMQEDLLSVVLLMLIYPYYYAPMDTDV